MRRDSIFYNLFQQMPSLLFELVEVSPPMAERYRFESVAVKEPKFEIDGVFLPPDSGTLGTVYFAEFQMQKDDLLYARLFGESLLYFYRNHDRFADWHAVVVYPTRSTEQSNYHPYRALIHSDQVHRIYLDELGDMASLPLGLAVLVLTTTNETEAPDAARMLIERARQAPIAPALSRGIIEMITTIMVYMFTSRSRQEIDEMLGTKLQDTRVYQEAKEEGKEEGKEEVALNMLRGNFPLEVIARMTGLTVSQLEQLRSQQQE